MKTLVHIVTWNCVDASLRRTVASVLNQKTTSEISVELTDNASTDGTVTLLERLREEFKAIRIYQNEKNLGFCGAHNQAVHRFLTGSYDFLLILNPDAFLEESLLEHLINRLRADTTLGAATPKILRSTPNGEAIFPPVIDAAGMCLTASLRHFDRGSGKIDDGSWKLAGPVFGGTGACLLLTRAAVIDLIVEDESEDTEAVAAIFPQLKDGQANRQPLFDEAFFAFREDADLAWRMQIRGWGCAYVPIAVALHVRRVTPERRAKLPKEINRHSVRNRFLLQLNNLPVFPPFKVIIFGVFLRNFLVIAGILLRERSSIAALKDVIILFKRAIRRRRKIAAKPGSDFDRGIRWAREGVT